MQASLLMGSSKELLSNENREEKIIDQLYPFIILPIQSVVQRREVQMLLYLKEKKRVKADYN